MDKAVHLMHPTLKTTVFLVKRINILTKRKETMRKFFKNGLLLLCVLVIAMARGASKAGIKYAFGVIGDSTFMHSGMTNLVDCVSTKTPVTIMILDNSIVAMTGCQKTIIPSSSFEPLVKGLGVEPERSAPISDCGS